MFAKYWSLDTRTGALPGKVLQEVLHRSLQSPERAFWEILLLRTRTAQEVFKTVW